MRFVFFGDDLNREKKNKIGFVFSLIAVIGFMALVVILRLKFNVL